MIYRIISKAVLMNCSAMLHSLPCDGSMQVKIEPYKKNRNLEQNAKLWAMLGEVSKQVNWHGNKLTPENWKDVFTASLKKQMAVPGIDGGFVVCGTSTSKMTVGEMAELIELITAFGVQHNVKFSSERT